MKQPKPLIIVHPDAATEDVKRVLSRAGYAVVVSDQPELFKHLDVQGWAQMRAMNRVALETLRDLTGDYLAARDIKAKYAKGVIEALLAFGDEFQ